MRLFLLIWLALVTTGCATARTVESAPLSAGATRAYNAPYASTIEAAKLSLPDVGLSVQSEKQVENGIIFIAKRGVTGWSWGELVRVLVQPRSSGSSVRIFFEPAFKMNVRAKDFTQDLFTRIGERLGEYP